ncbi:hypothetical protein CHARACLAT_014146 [Characodon lateralis]|uniref:Uncharacterized protein n=1 Tax=Characodon lateralis TaxID=208331 RepID=A0ABU7CQ82_9TELE|nr:hypothetical protein [Characodon lateralis]
MSKNVPRCHIVWFVTAGFQTVPERSWRRSNSRMRALKFNGRSTLKPTCQQSGSILRYPKKTAEKQYAIHAKISEKGKISETSDTSVKQPATSSNIRCCV